MNSPDIFKSNKNKLNTNNNISNTTIPNTNISNADKYNISKSNEDKSNSNNSGLYTTWLVSGTHHDIMKLVNLAPGPKVGCILSILLEDVLDDPLKNKKESLELRVKELALLPEAQLKKLAEKASDKKDEFEFGEEKEMKKKHHV